MKNVKKIAALGLSATMAMGMLPATLVQQTRQQEQFII